ncbi:MAG: transketolase [Bacteroidota bacterium]
MEPRKLSITQLREMAKEIRRDIIRMLVEAKSGHSGGPLGAADIFTVLYFGGVLRYRPDDPWWQDRDRLVLSAGHMCPVLYATLAEAGFFPKEELMTLRKLGSRLQGHPGRDKGLPGIETSSGSLGQGLSIAVGMALGGKYLSKANWRVYSFNGDGELQEGSIWEAIMAAGHYKLDNLTMIVDRNYCQIDGVTEQVMGIDPLDEKLRAFRWHVVNANGHDMESLLAAFAEARETKGKPTAIIARTIMGKGVSFMENDCSWHGKPPTKEQGERALAELQ